MRGCIVDDSSSQMTTDINLQVNNVVGMIDKMVALTAESGKHARVSSSDLDSLIDTTRRWHHYRKRSEIYSARLKMNLPW